VPHQESFATQGGEFRIASQRAETYGDRVEDANFQILNSWFREGGPVQGKATRQDGIPNLAPDHHYWGPIF